MSELSELGTRLGYHFKSPALLLQALTPAASQTDTNNERLEFLGDRVAGLVLAEALYKRFPDENEGDLAKRHAALVQGPVMCELAQEINLSAHIPTHIGTLTETMLADAFEALMGAIYLDSDFATAQRVILQLWADRVETMQAPPQDPKTALQEWAQARKLPAPAYSIIGKDGPDHAPLFTIQLELKGHAPISAKGRSRRDAEKLAAQAMLDQLATHR